ncbi:MAG TPA: aminodeoxychorismate synthase component I [Virgibacillus sp.]|nr:aminodeoxychorismate synthase component I [Virgibacillus sp.]
MSYEAAPAFDPNLHAKSGNRMPLLWFGIFPEPDATCKHSPENKQFQTGIWHPDVSTDKYYKNIDKIQDYMKQGQIKQVNYTIQMAADFKGDSFAFYKQLQQAQEATYTAYLDIGDFTILSASPELFFRLEDNKITTKPMKGTVRRGKTYQEDKEHAIWLYQSEKDRTENRLIVDVMRADLAKIAKAGTIKTTNLYEIEQYPTVYQMTSTVTADLQNDKNISDIFRALFPCGSITGLPKEKTMQVIADLEVAPREVYCGAIGFLTPENEAVFNVPIRTVTIANQNEQATYGVGGGITLDSTREGEYDEVLAKAKVLYTERPHFNLLETLGLFNGKYFLLENHLARLSQSAAYFKFSIDIEAIKNELLETAYRHPEHYYKVRLLVAKDGELTIDADKINHVADEMIAAPAESPIDKEDIFLYHKTTHRRVYDSHKQKQPHVSDILLWNEHHEVTEFTTGNIVVEHDGRLITPPITCGLLAGTFRDELVQKGIVKEQKVFLHELKDCSKIWYVNSVRKWVAVVLEKVK